MHTPATRGFRVLYLLILFAVCSHGQIPLHNQYFPLPFIESGFLKQNNSWRWNAGFDLSDNSDSGWQFHARERYTSDLLIPTYGLKQWKDEHRLTTDFSFPFRLGQFGLYTNSWIQSDELASRDNIFGNHAIGFFGEIASLDNWNLTPYVGYQQQRVRTQIDWGWDVGMKAELPRYRLGDYMARVLAETNYDFYDQLQNYENRLNIGVSRQFTPYTSDSLTIKLSESSKDNYSLDYSKIDKLQLNRKELQNKLFYLISARDLFTLTTLLQSRNLSQLSTRSIVYLENQMRYSHIGASFNYGFSMRTNSESQDNEGTLTDAETGETAMGLQLGYLFANKDLLNFDLTYIKLQYDTPDENNKDDRDEQRFVLTGQYAHRFSPYLNMELMAYVYLYHQIYIFKERSANNNWNRVIKLNPRISYRIPGFSNTLSTEVLANYTVYDFENEVLGTRSIVYRKYILADSLNASILPWIKAGAFVRVEKDDKGTYFKEEFAQQIVQSYDSQLYNFFLQHMDILNFRLKVGYSHYIRQEFRHVPVKAQARRISNRGPYFQLIYRGSERILLSANANLNYLQDSYVGASSYMTGTIRLRYLL